MSGHQGQAFVYVIGPPGGPQKIGMASDTLSRLRALQTSSPAQLVIAGHVSCGRTEASRIEREAHRLLVQHRLAGEWFAVSPADAVAAIERAAGRPCEPAPQSSREAWPAISAKQIKAARVFLEWEQRDLAEKSGLSLPTIQRMEKLGVERSSAGNAQRVQRALEDGA
jgi:hypothetical protein